MRRRLLTPDAPEIELSDASSEQSAEIKRLLEVFQDATEHNNDTYCVQLKTDIDRRRLSTDTIERLSVWCHTNQPPQAVQEAAQQLARALLGLVPPRLRNVGTSTRVDNYRELVDQVARQLTA